MTVAEIIFIVQMETGIAWSEIKKAVRGEALLAKYVTELMLSEEDLRHVDIAEILGLDRTAITVGLKTAGELLGDHKGLTDLYVACTTKRVELEESI